MSPTAKSPEQFEDRWHEHLDQLSRLEFSARTEDQAERVRSAREELKDVASEIAE